MDVKLLKNLPMFRGLAPPDFEKLLEIIEEKSFVAEQRLFSTGDPSEAFYIIEAGRVRIVDDTGGMDVEIATMGPGDFFGEMGVIEGSPRSAGAVMAEAGTLLEVEANEFHRFMAINPQISMKIMSTMSKRYRRKQTAPTSAERGREPGQVLGFFSATGGVGTSLVIANLAGAIKRLTGDRVAVLDMDLMFGDQQGIFDVKGTNSLAGIVDEPEIGLETLTQIVEATAAGVDLVPAPPQAIEAESITPELTRITLQVLREAYDWVLVDTSTDLRDINLCLIEAADRQFYVTSPEVLALKNALRWLSILDLVNLPSDAMQVIVNKEGRSGAGMREDIRKSIGREILATLPHKFADARNSLNRGKLLAEIEPDSELTAAVDALAAAITGVEAPRRAAAEPGLWGRLTSWAT